MAAIDDITLRDSGNFKVADNSNTAKDILFTYRVKDNLGKVDETNRVPVYASDSTSLGIISAGGGQNFTYYKKTARYRDSAGQSRAKRASGAKSKSKAKPKANAKSRVKRPKKR